MEPGQLCRLHLSCPLPSNPLSSTAATQPSHQSSQAEEEERGEITVTGVVVAVRPHAEDRHRRLYYVRCSRLDLGAALARQRKAAAAPSWYGVALGTIGSGTMHSCNELRVTSNGFMSNDGYHYRFEGWYDASALDCVPEEVPQQQQQTDAKPGEGAAVVSLSPSSSPPPNAPASAQRRHVPEEWVTAMERDTAICEVVYLCYAFLPWFPAPYTALQYLALPEEDVCHSVYLCHRCLSPFFTREQYFVHLEGQYCLMRTPPGRLLYLDGETGHKAFLVDGAKDLHYCRCLSLLGKHFIESKLLYNDVDLYEYVIVTLPRASLPRCEGVDASAEEFSRAAAAFDSEDWDGDVVMGYVSRLKHHPDHTLSCIVTLPIFQRMRVGTFLLDLAYWMTAQRQCLCGAARCCGHAGGAISRPFSPHGQSLLLSYWRRALLRALSDVAPRRRASRTAQAEPSFTLAELRAMFHIPIHASDLETLLLQSEFTFYAAGSSSGRRDSVEDGAHSSLPSSRTSSGGGGGTSAAVAVSSSMKNTRPESHGGGRSSSASSVLATSPVDANAAISASSTNPQYTATIMLESTLLDKAQERPAKASRGTHVVFKKRWLVKDSRGVYAYDFPQFHY